MFETAFAELLWTTAMVLADVTSNLVVPGIALYVAQVGALAIGLGLFWECCLLIIVSVFFFTTMLVLLEAWRDSLAEEGPLRIIAYKVLLKGNLICFVISLYNICTIDLPTLLDETLNIPFMIEAATILFIVLKFVGYVDPPNILSTD